MTVKEKMDDLRDSCELICGGGLVGPSTSYFSTTEDENGVSQKYVYMSQAGGIVKDGLGANPLPPFSKTKEPTEEDIDRCISEFLDGFKKIAAEKRNSGEGLVWRTTPRVVYNEDAGELYVRARYAFVPPCKIVYPGINDGIRDVVSFGGGFLRT